MQESAPEIVCRTATKDDLLGVGRVYLRAFPGTLEELHSPHLKPKAVADMVGTCLAVEPDCIDVAVAGPDGPVVGYCIGIANIGAVLPRALLHGMVFVCAGHWIVGQYGLPVTSALALLSDKISFVGSWRRRRAERKRAGSDGPKDPHFSCPSRILSIAVDPDWQAHGIGGRLMDISLNRFRSRGLPCVRLEVRPDNTVAKGLYERLGFREVGEFPDTRGAWTIMVMKLE